MTLMPTRYYAKVLNSKRRKEISKFFRSILFVMITTSLVLAACGTPAAPVASDWSVVKSAVDGGGMDALVAAAKAEGELNVITLPRDWCNYGEAMDTFAAKYGIKVNSLNPDGGSADEIQAIIDNKENKGPQAPDVIDVGPAYGPLAKEQGLITPYKVATWDTI